MNKLIQLVILIASLNSVFGGTLTATDDMWDVSLEFNNDPTISNGPDYNYTWINSQGQHSVNGVTYVGPGWVYAFYDFDWNLFDTGFVSGYSIDLIPSVTYVFGWVEQMPLFTGETWIFYPASYSYTFSQFLIDFGSLGGSYTEPIALKNNRGKKHRK